MPEIKFSSIQFSEPQLELDGDAECANCNDSDEGSMTIVSSQSQVCTLCVISGMARVMHPCNKLCVLLDQLFGVLPLLFGPA